MKKILVGLFLLVSFPALSQTLFSGGGTGGGGGGDVNIAGVNGSVPSLGNPLFVAPSTGSVWDVGAITSITNPVAVTQSGTWNINNISGTISLPTGAATSANQTSGGQKTQIVDGSGNVIGATSNALNVNCSSGCSGSGGGTSSNYGSAFPSAGTAIGFTDGTNMVSGRVGDVNNVATATNYLNVLNIGRYNATQPTLTDTRYNALQVGSRGELLVGVGTTGFAVSQSGTWNVGTLTTITNAVTVAQSTAASLNATVVGTGTFATQAAQSGTWNITNISGTVSLPTGASTSANQASIIGTKNAGTAATNSELVGGVYNSTPLTLTDTQQASIQFDANGYLKVNVASGGGSGGTSSTFGAAFPATGTAAGMSQGGNMVAMTGTTGNLNVQCANCSGSGASAVDEAAFTAGSSVFAPAGGFFQTTATSNALTNGQQGMWQMTATRSGFVNLRNNAGTEVGTSTTPLQVSLANTGSNATAVSISAASGSIASGAVASGAFASGAVASGAYASGSLASGAVVDITNLSTPITPATATATKGILLGGQYNSTQATFTNGQQGSVQLTSRGAIMVATGADTFNTTVNAALPAGTALIGKVGLDQTTPGTTNAVAIAQIGANTVLTGNGVTGTGSQRVTIASDNTAFSVNATLSAETTKVIGTVNQGTSPWVNNTSQINGVTVLMGNGTTGTGSQRVTIASDNTAFTVNPASATTPVSTMNSASAASGVNSALALVFDDASPTAITENNFGFARMSANRNQYITIRDAAGNERGVNVNANSALSTAIDQTTIGTTNGVRVVAGTANGSSTTGNIVANNTTAVVVKASAGVLYGVQLAGLGSAPAYLKIYNATSATCGSGTPVKRLMIPAASTAANGAGSNITFGSQGVTFGTGITYCVTTGIADNDTTAPAASTFLVNVDWL